MKWLLFGAAICLLCLHSESKTWSAEELRPRRHNSLEYSNEIPTRRSIHHKSSSDPPDHTKLVEMARYVMHNCVFYRMHFGVCAGMHLIKFLLPLTLGQPDVRPVSIISLLTYHAFVANDLSSFVMGTTKKWNRLPAFTFIRLQHWASIATISILPAIEGFPFSNVKSIVDGSLANSTGVPYFYMSPLDFTARDLSKNTRATVLVSLEETNYCETHNLDPEDPRCTRLMLSGKMKKVKEGTPEYTFAKAALFERHPAMANFPPDHNWFVAKMKIAQIAMIDWFGGAKYISVKEYLAYNYTGNEMLHYYSRLHQ